MPVQPWHNQYQVSPETARQASVSWLIWKLSKPNTAVVLRGFKRKKPRILSQISGLQTISELKEGYWKRTKTKS